jgi:hypothetical protein
VAHPVERAFRDARGLRVAGGVDEMLDRWSAIECLAGPSEQSIPAQADPPDLHLGRLRGHRRALVRLVQDFGETCASASEHGSDGLRRRQRLAGLLGRTAGELLGMAVVLARSGGRRDSDAERDRIADVACARARHRLATLWSELDEELERSDVPHPSLRPLEKT